MRGIEALPRLYLITDRHAVRDGDLVTAVGAAIAGGVRLVQLREKDLGSRELRALAAELRRVTAGAGARLLVNAGDSRARIDLAADIGADGVHLTSSASITVSDARDALGDEAIVGVSTHSLAEVERADADGATLVTFGPVFATPSKQGLGEPTGAEALSRAVAVAGDSKVYALGGIDEARADEVLASGAHGIALIRAILASDDPRTAAARLRERAARK